MTTRVPLIATLLLLATGAAACGGDDDGGGSAGAASGLAKAELAQQADKLCASAEQQLESIDQPANMADANQAAAYFGEIVPVATKLQADLEALEPADDVKADYDAFLAAQRKGTRLLEQVVEKARAKDPSGLELLGQFDGISGEVDKTASKLGMTKCGGQSPA